MVRVLACFLSIAALARAQAVSYSGTVTDRAHNPLAEALVRLQGANLSALSGSDGKFTLSGSAAVLPAPARAPDGTREGGSALPDGRRPSNLRATVLHVLLAVPAAGAPPAAKPASQGAATVTRRLLAGKAGFVTGVSRQSLDTRTGIALSLYPWPSPAEFADAKKACLDTVNALRALSGLNALTWSAKLEAFADSGAHYDSDRGTAHQHFKDQNKPLVADAENALPGWDYGGSLSAIARQGTHDMWAEGPGGGHYENIKGVHTIFGCGFYINADGGVWVVQDFR